MKAGRFSQRASGLTRRGGGRASAALNHVPRTTLLNVTFAQRERGQIESEAACQEGGLTTAFDLKGCLNYERLQIGEQFVNGMHCDVCAFSALTF